LLDLDVVQPDLPLATTEAVTMLISRMLWAERCQCGLHWVSTSDRPLTRLDRFMSVLIATTVNFRLMPRS
jgi:hypothetical protein